MKIDYWRVVDADASASLAGKLHEALSWPIEEPSRLFPGSGGKTLRLQDLAVNGGQFEGQFATIALSHPGYVADTQGGVSPIKFNDDQGLGNFAAFVFLPDISVLALERDRSASSSRIAKYFAQLLENFDLDLLPIPTQDALKRLAGLEEPSRVVVKVSGGTGPIEEVANKSVNSLLRLRERVGAPQLSVELSVGKRWRTRSLNPDKVLGLVRSFLGQQEVHVDKLIVSGKNSEDERDVIDLVTERIKSKVELEPDEGRGVSYRARSAAIRSELRELGEQLRVE